VPELLRKAVFVVKVGRDESSNYRDILNSIKKETKEGEGRKERFPSETDLNWHLPCIIKLPDNHHRTNSKYRRYVAINKIN
jgi:hypothetical protein